MYNEILFNDILRDLCKVACINSEHLKHWNHQRHTILYIPPEYVIDGVNTRIQTTDSKWTSAVIFIDYSGSDSIKAVAREYLQDLLREMIHLVLAIYGCKCPEHVRDPSFGPKSTLAYFHIVYCILNATGRDNGGDIADVIHENIDLQTRLYLRADITSGAVSMPSYVTQEELGIWNGDLIYD